MDKCFKRLGEGFYSKAKHFKTASEAYSYLEDLNFESGTIGDNIMSYTEKVKLCKMVNANRCPNLGVSVSALKVGGFEIQ